MNPMMMKMKTSCLFKFNDIIHNSKKKIELKNNYFILCCLNRRRMSVSFIVLFYKIDKT